MKTILTTLALMLFFSLAKAQEIRVQGVVVNDKTGAPVAGATAVLYHAEDSTMQKIGITENDGQFTFQPVKNGAYYVMITSIGYEVFYTKGFEINGANVQIDTIGLNQAAEMMKGIVISAKKPLVERKIDKLVVNVESLLTASGNSALELLEKAPGVQVDQDGKISMRGKSGVVILIDDRPTHLSGEDLANYLKSMPASTVAQLEVMTNPSAKYDAAGNAGVINIRTKKMKSYGFNGNVSASAMYSDAVRTNGSLNLNYRKGKVNLFGTYSYSNTTFINGSHFIRNFRKPGTDEIESIFDQTSDRSYHGITNSVKAGVDFYAGKHTVAGIVLSGNHTDRTHNIYGKSFLKSGVGSIDSSLVSYNRMAGDLNNFSANANLRHTFDSAGKMMTMDLDYIRYDQSQNNRIATDYFLPDGSSQKPTTILDGDMPATISIYSAKTDFTFPLKDGSKLETGLKASQVETDNDARYQYLIDKGGETDFGKSNHFIYKETILAGYLSWNRQIKKWGIQAGLRAEQTYSNGHQLGNVMVPDSSFDKSYLNLFPTLYVTYQADKNNALGFNYGRRIQRPAYQDLNPFLYFLDEYTYEVGNVYLQPEFTNQIELSYDYKGKWHSSVNYNVTHNAIAQVLRQNTEKRITYQTNDNIADVKSLVFSTGANVKTGKILTSNIDLSLSNNRFEGELASGYLNTNGWLFTANLSEQMNWGDGWSTEVSGFYRSRTIDGQIEILPMWRTDLAVQKSILKDKGSINLFVRDIFDSQKFKGYIHSGEIDMAIDNQRINRTFGVSFKYRFGKPIKNLKQHQSTGASEEQNRVKTN